MSIVPKNLEQLTIDKDTLDVSKGGIMKRGYMEMERGRLADSENVKGLINFWEKRLEHSSIPVDPMTSVFIQATIGVLRSVPIQSDENSTDLSPKEKYEHISRLLRKDTQYQT
jgi:hypothetical protein